MSFRGDPKGAFGLRSFFAWWLAEFVGLVPDAVVRGLGLAVDVLAIRCENDRVILEYRPRGRSGNPVPAALDEFQSGRLPAAADRLLSGVEARDVRVELDLDESLVLTRSLRLPRTAEHELAGVLSFEIERHTPYRADEVVFVHAVDAEASDNETMAIDLTIVPRQTVDGFVQCLQRYGLTLDVIRTAGSGNAAGRPTHAISGNALGIPHRRMGLRVPVLAAAAVIFGVVAIASPLLSLQAEGQELRASIATGRDHAATTLALREDVEQTQKAARQLALIRSASPPLIRILDTLSELLPDGTWLRNFSKVEDKVLIEGLTDSSARLVDLLDASPLFESVTYVAPVTRERGGRVERFSFSLTVTGG